MRIVFYFIISSAVLVLLCGTENTDFFFTEDPQAKEKVIEGSEFIFKCDVSNRSEIAFSWMLNEADLANTSRRFQVGSYLHVKSVSRELDSGEFKCVATNFKTKHSLTSTIGTLVISWLGTDVSVVGDDAELEKYSKVSLRCLTTASSLLNYEWFRNGHRIYYLRDDKYETDDNTLTIYDLNEDDIGVYSCKAIIELSEINAFSVYSSQDYFLKLKTDPTIYPQLVDLTSSKVIKANENSSLELVCSFKNYEKIEWEFSHKEATVHHTTSNGSLVLKKLRYDNSGFYTCKATNHGRLSTAYSMRVQVLTVADLELYPSNMNRIYVTQVHTGFSLICAYPNIKPKHVKMNSIAWYDSAGPMDNAEDGNLNIHELTFEHSNNYTCVATVESVIKSTTISLYVIETPFIIEMPEDHEVTQKNENVDFKCKFMFDTRGYSDDIILPEIQLHVNWYFSMSQSFAAENENDDAEKDKTSWKLIATQSRLDLTIVKNEFISKLSIQSVSQSDYGSYKCEIRADNFNAVSSQLAKLYTVSNISFNDNTLILSCNTVVNAIEDLKWVLPDGKTVLTRENTAESLLFKVAENGSLILVNATRKNSGIYTCIQKTRIGDEYFTHSVEFNETQHELVVVRTIRNTKLKRSPLNIKQTIIIVVACSVMYLIVTGLIIFYGKNKFFNANTTCNKRKRHTLESSTDADTDKNNIQYVKTLNSSNEITETSEMLIKQPSKQTASSCASGSNQNQNSRQLTSQHQYENIDENSQMEIKKFLEANSSSHGKVPVVRPRHIQPAPSQSSIGTNLTLSSVTKLDTDEYLGSLHNFVIYGKCCYGDVYLANSSLVRQSRRSSVLGRKTVALKILRNFHHDQSVVEFHRDIETYSKLSSDNVARLIDVCTEVGGDATNVVILEHSEHGDLREFLEQRSEAGNNLTAFEKLHICYQIAQAMMCFEQNMLIHGDLAARNCIIFPGNRNNRNFHIKVSNLALCYDKYQHEYVYKSEICGGGGNSSAFPIPLRWMSPEWLLDSNQSTKSDVWSYAVCCWEIWKNGTMPYDGLSDLEVYQALKNYDLCRLDSLADLCPVEMWTLMEKCWRESINMRPGFTQCVSVLHSLLNDISLKVV